MNVNITRREAWAAISTGDTVQVRVAGRLPYPAEVDTKTGDSTVIWVIDDAGTRRAFDHREDVDLIALP